MYTYSDLYIFFPFAEATYERTFTKMAIDQFITAVVSSNNRVSFDGQSGEDESERYTIMTPRDKRALRLASQVQSDAVFESERIGMVILSNRFKK